MEKSCTIHDVFERFYPSYEKRNWSRSHWKSSKKRMQNEEKFAMIEEGEECL